jgi:hypothetical protein
MRILSCFEHGNSSGADSELTVRTPVEMKASEGICQCRFDEVGPKNLAVQTNQDSIWVIAAFIIST